jgi:pimeloyl-ACP methyl ester carboxylesterase
MPRRAAALALLLLLGCAGRAVISGWAQVAIRPVENYQDHFSHSPFGTAKPTCAELGLKPEGPVLVLVPGIRGDGEEFEESLPILAASRPAGMFMFRWVLMEKLPGMASDLAHGISRLVACRPKQPVVVLAHSAGGVIVATAASKLVIPAQSPDDVVTILTVAAPLAGTMARERRDAGRPPPLMIDIATHIRSYASAPRGVRAAHLRTAYPADELMEPSGDFVPNDPAVGIPLARQIDLPPHLGHDESLIHVAYRLADGSWRDWFPAR